MVLFVTVCPCLNEVYVISGAFLLEAEKNLLLSSCLSVRLSARISAAPTGQIFVKFIIV
jgi:hypothetical protein